jgi:hypothetical protein
MQTLVMMAQLVDVEVRLIGKVTLNHEFAREVIVARERPDLTAGTQRITVVMMI